MLALLTNSYTRRTLLCMSAAALLWSGSSGGVAGAARYAGAPEVKTPAAAPKDAIATARKELYEQMSAATGIPWFRFAAIDQYERTIGRIKKSPAASETDSAAAKARVTGISIPAPVWSGPLNPDQEDKQQDSIRFFGGFGWDGSGDGLADPRNDADVLYSMARHLLKYGNSPSDFSIAVWEYYHNGRAAQRVAQFSKLYEHFGRLDLGGSAFPLPIGTNYAYRSTWGTARGWGGVRIHEGTDLFAPHGLTVRSTCYGVVETKGWNRYGGWRVGIRDIENRYHYYAHLMGYEKSLQRGDIVVPGQTIGWVGSSGYGNPGTQGKFPPHLHYGIYRDRGITEWAFDPYPLLKQWENQEFRKLRSKKNK